MSEIKKTSKEWLEDKKYKGGITIIEPVGWDNENYDYSFNKEKITEGQFNLRLLKSSVAFHPKK